MIPVDATDRRLVRELQDSIPLTENPYATIGDRLGLTEDEVVERLRALRRSGRLKRIGAVLRHREAGFGANAMVVFAAPPEAIETLGSRLAESPLVSHCYERPAYVCWPFSLYAMVHARTEEEIGTFVRAFVSENGIRDFRILPSLEELKKTSMTWVREDAALMVCLHGAAKDILVVGGGPVALRKIRTLLSGGATVRLAAPEAVPEIADMAAEGRLAWERRVVARGDFERHRFALLALPPEETKEAAVLAAGTGCLLDCCADAGACDWSLAAQFRAGGFTVGVASGGASPSGAAALKERLRAFLEDEPADENARS